MTLPVTITKTWLTAAGDPQAGTVKFRLTTRLTDIQPGTDVPAGSLIEATLDDTGAISQPLYPGAYHVQEMFGNYAAYDVTVTTAGELPPPSTPLPVLPPESIIDGGTP